jgi:Alpha/beta hydrolase domain
MERTVSRRRVVLVALTALLVAPNVIQQPAAQAETPNPIVRGPVSGGVRGYPQFASLYPMAANGYAEEEFFISGESTNLSSGRTLPYTTRIVVRRPVNPHRFNGTAVVEWVNVTGAADLETLWPSSGEWAMRQGYAWVSVSAQLVGTCCGPHSLKGWDPVRYAPILHPGDDYSFDIFSQAMAAVKRPHRNRTALDTPARVDPMGGLRVEHIIAHGASQSAGRLTTYITGGYHQAADLADAFSVTRGGGSQAVADIAAETDTLVVQVQEESQGARPADTDHYIVYEEPGIAHAPVDWYSYVWRAQARDLTLSGPNPDAAGAACSMNRGTSNFTHRMSVLHTQRWLERGVTPPSAPRLERDEAGDVARDANGLALGGIRYPFIEVPTAYNSAEGCPLFGQYIPWSKEKIVSLYPTKEDYVSRVDEVVEDRVREGLMLWEDGVTAMADARAVDAWDGGTCFDTAQADANETGPVSGPVAGAYAGTTTLGVPNAAHEVNCTAAGAGA